MKRRKSMEASARRWLGILLFFMFTAGACAQADPLRVLVFSKTAGFRHDSISDGLAMIQTLAAGNNFIADATEDATAFNDTNLSRYQAVVFLSTTGDVLDEAQQRAFERYIRAGGGYAGIHAASDTEHGWPWYGRLVGAYFKGHPAVQQAEIQVADLVHPSSAMLPKRWVRTDEWYNFQSNPRGQVHVLATLDEKSYAPGPGAMGFDHPIAWCHEFEGGRAWYTGGGHTRESFSEPLFQLHVLGGILWAAGRVAGDAGATIDSNFQWVVLDAEPENPMELAVARDGRVFYIERGGRIKIWKPDTQGIAEAGRLPVFAELEDGLLGIALDPGFSTNQWLYLFYSPAGAEEKQHVSRFAVVGDKLDISSEKVLLAIPTQRQQCCHSAGSLAFGPGGVLFIATGDNTNPFESQGYSPIDERSGRGPWDAQKSSANANDLRGKVLRIVPQPDGTYTIPPGNLFPPGTPNTRPEIYVMGNRNPFRIGVDQRTGWLYWGEVGPDAIPPHAARGPAGHDEWNQARSAGNYGWPYFIGDNKAYLDFDFQTGVSGAPFDAGAPKNDSPFNTGPGTLPPAQPAWIWYPYSSSSEFPEVGFSDRRCAMGGPVYHYDHASPSRRKLPRYYDRTVFIYEWARHWIREVKLDDQGRILKINPFLPSLRLTRPIEMEIGPDGAIYMIEWGSEFEGDNKDARVIRIDYVAGNRAPTVSASAAPDSGGAPLTVQFSSANTSDPDPADKLAYAWSFLGDGTIQSTEPNPVFTYAAPGNYTARLTVTDSFGNASVANLSITAGNHRPVLTLDAPPDGAFFDWGEALAYAVRVADVEDGNTANSAVACPAVTVQPLIGHNDHSHPLLVHPGCTGVFDAPAGHGEGSDNLFLVVQAGYTDRGAPGVAPLAGRAVHRLYPKRKQAEHHTRDSGVNAYGTDDAEGGGLELRDIDHDDYIAFQPVNLTNISSVTYRVAAELGARVEARAGSPSGTLLSSAEIPRTGGAYTNVTAGITDPGETHELFFVFRRNAGDRELLRLNWIEFEGAGVALKQTPFAGRPAKIPGIVQAEDFDEGGEGVSFHDLTPANEGGQYRPSPVDIESTTDAEGGFNIGWTAAGEWLEYSLDSAVDGTFQVDIRVAAARANTTFHLEFNGADVTGPMAIPATGGGQNWTTVTQTNITLRAGPHRMRLTFDRVDSEPPGGNVNWFRFTATATNVVPILQSALMLPGTFRDEPAAVVNPAARTIAFPQAPGERYLRLRATKPTRITGVKVLGGSLVLTYEEP